MLNDAKTNSPTFSTSDFPVLISDLIDEYCSKKGITQYGFALECRLDRNTVKTLRNGKRVTKSLIIIICIVMKVSVKKTKDLLESAGYNLDPNNNSDKAYLYFLESKLNIDECEKQIMEWNKTIKSKYEMDQIKHLHRKKNNYY